MYHAVHIYLIDDAPLSKSPGAPPKSRLGAFQWFSSPSAGRTAMWRGENDPPVLGRGDYLQFNLYKRSPHELSGEFRLAFGEIVHGGRTGRAKARKPAAVGGGAGTLVDLPTGAELPFGFTVNSLFTPLLNPVSLPGKLPPGLAVERSAADGPREWPGHTTSEWRFGPFEVVPQSRQPIVLSFSARAELGGGGVVGFFLDPEMEIKPGG